MSGVAGWGEFRHRLRTPGRLMGEGMGLPVPHFQIRHRNIYAD